MAENKKSFILYADLITQVEKLVLQDRANKTNYAGELFLHILKYVNDQNPVPIDFIIDMAFEPIKLQLKRDLEKYILSKHDKSVSGRIGNLKRWNKDLYDEFVSDSISLEEAENIAKHRKTSQPDTLGSQPFAKVAVNVTDNVTVTATVNETKKNIINNSKFSDECKIPSEWMDVVAKSVKIKTDAIPLLISNFDDNLIIREEQKKSLKEYKEHFANWILKQDLSQFNKIESIGKTNQI